MTRLEDLKVGSKVRGLDPRGPAEIVSVEHHGEGCLTVVYRDTAGTVRDQLVFRDMEERLEIETRGSDWSFEADGSLLRLVSEAYRINLAYLFDPFLAVHTSQVDPLPHQITAVYEELLPRQPLRFLLADDPGSGKTIMAGLFIKELIIRGDVDRCLVVCPGALQEQWQDELESKFGLRFSLINRHAVDASPTGNPFEDHPLAIARLDHLSRNEDLQEKLRRTEWDLVICDEAHKMSATYWGNEVKYTKRFHLGRLLSETTRHLLLMTATPHNGKEQDFHLFLSLLDGDRFEGKARDGLHYANPSDLMRRMVKEDLVKFDGKPLFPERKAYTVDYPLSDAEALLYLHVTDYVREEFNRADALQDDRRKGNVGFALTVLQRRLASSPEAIYQSLKRRRMRLEKRVQEVEVLGRGEFLDMQAGQPGMTFTEEDLEDLDEAPDSEVEEAEQQVLDQATTARTIQELKVEIALLRDLEQEAETLVRSGQDRKWEEFSTLLQSEKMQYPNGHRRKLVVFTEHRDTVNYLIKRIGTLIGPDAIRTIHGGMGREDRKHAETAFTQDRTVSVLVATDAAGEGINLQRAHLMVNYDLPWNPNRLEQRFGRIHRIGQTEVCHLWNLVAGETREGQVFLRLCEKLSEESDALQGKVFNVLGQAFSDTPLRELLVKAIRYGEDPEVRRQLDEVINGAMDRDKLIELLKDRALCHDSMDASKLQHVRDEMERAEARRLQPHFIESFFLAAFERLGGRIAPREAGRYEIHHVPARIRNRDRQIGTREAVLPRYQRITFEKGRVHLTGKPMAAFVAPGSPLLNAVIDLILEDHRALLRQGAILVHETDPDEDPKALLYMEHDVQTSGGKTGPKTLSKQLQFVWVRPDGTASNAGPAPYLDCRPLEPEEHALLTKLVQDLPTGEALEQEARSHAIRELVPRHLNFVKSRTEERVEKTVLAVKERLTLEIRHWDHRATQLRLKEEAGKKVNLPWHQARNRADELERRLAHRMEELTQEREISATPPRVIGGALVIPQGLLQRLKGDRKEEPALFAKETKRVELAGMKAVMVAEKCLGNEPRDVSAENCGWDVESRDGATGTLRFIEVKGRIRGAQTLTVTRNEILQAKNKPGQFFLALVSVPPEGNEPGAQVTYIGEGKSTYGTESGCLLRYLRDPFTMDPDFHAISVNFHWGKLWEQGEDPLAERGD